MNSLLRIQIEARPGSSAATINALKAQLAGLRKSVVDAQAAFDSFNAASAGWDFAAAAAQIDLLAASVADLAASSKDIKVTVSALTGLESVSGAGLTTLAAGLTEVGAALSAVAADGEGSATILRSIGTAGKASTADFSAMAVGLTEVAGALGAITAQGDGSSRIISGLGRLSRLDVDAFTAMAAGLTEVGAGLEAMAVSGDAAIPVLEALTAAWAAAAAASKVAAAGFASAATAEGAAATVQLEGAMGSVTTTAGALSGALTRTGNVLTRTFTLPILAAGAAGVYFGVQTDKAFTGLEKVYGQASGDVNAFARDQTNLGKVFMALSNIYGKSESDVISLGQAWASAGYQGGALALQVRNTMDALTLGNFSAPEDAFTQLQQITLAYGLSTEQLHQALADLDKVSDTTSTKFSDLTSVLATSGIVGNAAGISLRQLAAMATLLVPALGGASAAGSSLQKIITRIMAPTTQAKELFKTLGIQWDQTFSKMSGTDRLQTLAQSFNKLTDAQKTQATALVAGRFQIQGFDTLMKGLIDTNSTYYKTLQNTSNAQADLARETKDVSLVLSSNSAQFSIIWQRIKNLLQQAVVPLIPALIQLLNWVLRLTTAFSNLPVWVQKLSIIGLLSLAAVGPLVKVVDSVKKLIFILGDFGSIVGSVFGFFSSAVSGAAGLLGTVFLAPFRLVGDAVGFLYRGLLSLVGALLDPIGAIETAWAGIGAVFESLGAGLVAFITAPETLIVAALVAVAVLFRKQIAGFIDYLNEMFPGIPRFFDQVFGSVVHIVAAAFNALPSAVRSGLQGVLSTVAAFVTRIVDWLSYLNPFARHSPSLVDNVKAGVAVIAAEYKKLSGLSAVFGQAADEVERFNQVTAAAQAAGTADDRSKQKASILSVSPGAGAEVDAMNRSIDALNGQLALLQQQWNDQEKAVAAAQAAFDKIDASVKAATSALDGMKAALAQTKSELDAAQGQLDTFTNAQIQGYGAADDAVFANTMAQKQLQLQIMQMEDATGPIDDLRTQLAGLQGDIETATSKASDLQKAGAGSDILDTYKQQIAGLRSQQKAIKDSTAPIEALQAQLDALQRAGQELDLQKSIDFDPLQRQIDKLTSSIVEMPFDDIVAGITKWQAQVKILTDQYNSQSDAVDRQQKALDDLNAQRDLAQQLLDSETAKANALSDAYDGVTAAIQQMQQALADLASTAEKAKAAKSGGGADIGGAGDFGAGVGGAPPNLQAPDLGDLAKQWEDEAQKAFGGVDLFKPIKDQWNNLKTWFSTNVSPTIDQIGTDFKNMVSKWDFSGVWDAIKNGVSNSLTSLESLASTPQLGLIGRAFKIVGSDIEHAFDDALSGIKRIGGEIVDAISGWGDLVKPAIGAFTNVFHAVEDIYNVYIKPVLALIILDFTVSFSLLSGLVKPLLQAVADVIGPIMDLIHDNIKLVLDLIDGNWSAVWTDIGNLTKDAWELINVLIQAAIDLATGIFKAFWHAISDGFKLFGVDLQQIWDNVKSAFVETTQALSDLASDIWNALVDFIRDAINRASSIISTVMGTIKSAWDTSWHAVSLTVDTVWTGIKTSVQTASDFVFGIIDGFLKNISGGWSFVWTAMGSIVTDVWTGIKSAIETGINAAVDAINVFIRIVDAISFDIPSFHIPGTSIGFDGQHIGFNISPIPPVKFAGGGIVPGGWQTAVPAVVHGREMILNGSQQMRLWSMLSGTSNKIVDSKQGGATYIFNGDLSFPNVKKEDDAKGFLTNLKVLAGSP